LRAVETRTPNQFSRGQDELIVAVVEVSPEELSRWGLVTGVGMRAANREAIATAYNLVRLPKLLGAAA
jgi:hypothetical protein